MGRSAREMSASAFQLYESAGLRIRSEIPLSATRVDPDLRPDVEFTIGEVREMPYERVSADVVAELVVDRVPWYSFCRVDGGYVGRLWEIGDFVIDESLGHVVCHPVPGGKAHVIPIVVPGTITAFLLAQSGRFVLHASAVELGGTSVAFVGASGQGKTTMATILCAAGGRLITDDVLRVEFASADENGSSATRAPEAEHVYCRKGASELRLRPKAASLLDSFGDDAAKRVTEDERHALSPAMTSHDRVRLGAIVLPRPDRERSVAEARRLGPGEASIWLGRCQRIEGWRDPVRLRQQFEYVSRTAATVPVYEVFVPWGPPFAEDLAEQVLGCCGLAGDRLAGDQSAPPRSPRVRRTTSL